MLLVRRLAPVTGASAALFLGGASCSILVDTSGLAGAGTADSDPAQPDANAAQPDADAGGSSTSDAGGGGGPLDEYGALVLADAPSLYYRFEDTSGDVRDETGAHPGKILGAPGRGAEGAFRGSKAIRLGGLDDGIDVGDVFAFDGLSPYTLEAWFRPDAYDDEYRFIVARDNSPSLPRQEYGIYVRSDGWKFERYVDDESRSALFQPPPAAGAWYHVVATYDGAVLGIFIDGQLRKSQTDQRPFKPTPTTLFVGRGGWPESSLRGVLDEVAIYEKALSPDRIKAHYEAALRAR